MRTSTPTRIVASTAIALSIGLALSACQPTVDSREVTLIVHNSFPAEAAAAAASQATGFEVSIITAGDGGELTNKLVLTKGAPIADAYFGVDNAYLSRLSEHNVSANPVEITNGATCINIDPAWFAEQEIPEPTNYEDLVDPQYRGLSVLLDPTSSSTGASFLIGTVAYFGEDGFAEYWQQLAENDVRIEQGWETAYNTNFTQSGGTYPIVLSYSSSPAWTISEDGMSTATKALLDTCSSQIEYAGVLTGAQNQGGAEAVVEYLTSRDFQDTIADTMYVYPAVEDAYLPETWQEFAPAPSNPNDLSPEQIGAGRDAWLRTWSEAVGQ